MKVQYNYTGYIFSQNHFHREKSSLVETLCSKSEGGKNQKGSLACKVFFTFSPWRRYHSTLPNRVLITIRCRGLGEHQGGSLSFQNSDSMVTVKSEASMLNFQDVRAGLRIIHLTPITKSRSWGAVLCSVSFRQLASGLNMGFLGFTRFPLVQFKGKEAEKN